MMIHSHNQYGGDLSERMERCHSYVLALEEERRKVLLFRRELPLCLEIVTQAIEACKKQLSGRRTDYNQSDSSEQTSAVAVFEEFIPITKATSSASNVERDDDDDDECKNPSSHKDEGNCNKETNYSNNAKKSDWLRSVRLWNQTPDPADIIHEDPSSKTIDAKDASGAGAFHPLKKEKINLNAKPLQLSSTSGVREDKSSAKKEKEGKSSKRKTRRCWSPELHRRFLQALKQLGGSHAATPKQIRELMKVDGLTNDEVKSHLQKYRLHTRRPSPSVSINTAGNTPQFVVVGGIWVPPEYSLVANKAKSGESSSIATTSNGI